MKLEFEIAKTVLKDNSEKRIHNLRFRSAFLGILFAALGLFLGSAFMGGYHKTFKSAILNFNAHITIKRAEGYLTESDIQKINATLAENKKQFSFISTPFLYWESLVLTQEGMQACVLKGIDFSKIEQIYPFVFQKIENSHLEKPKVYVGYNLFQKLSDNLKNDFKVSFLKNQKFKQQNFDLEATFQTGIEPYDSEFILMDLDTLQNHIVQEEKPLVLGYEIRLENIENIELLAQKLREEWPWPITIQTWDEINSSLLHGLQLEKITFMAVGFCILSIACLNIFGFNLMVFLQNKQTFRVLYYMGLSQKRLRTLFICMSVFVGLSASILGYILAFFIVYVINSQNGFQIHVPGLPPLVLWGVWDAMTPVLFLSITIIMSLLASLTAMRSIFKNQSHI